MTPPPANPDAITSPSDKARDATLLLVAALLGLGSLLFAKLALISVFVSWVTFIWRDRLRQRWRKSATVAIAISSLGSSVGLVRFTLFEAIPGILRGGNQAADRYGLSQARQIVTAEDALRKGAFMDHDQDAVGSAGRIAELAGLVPLRGGDRMALPALNYSSEHIVDTAMGPAVQVGAYLLTVCLPVGDRDFSAQATTAINEERAERSYYVYAWPVATGLGVQNAYCVDQDERIWASANSEGASLRFAGPSFPPQCGSVLEPKAGFSPWMDKQPRKELPGDPGR